VRGFWHDEAGVIEADKAIKLMLKEAVANGAEIHYNTRVAGVDDLQGSVTLDYGKKYFADKLVVSAGWQTPRLKNETYFKTKVKPTDTFYLENTEGLPPVFTYYYKPDCIFFGLKDGPGLKGFKMGIDFEHDTSYILERLTEFVPTKVPLILSKTPCYYTETHDGEYIFKQETDKAFYCFGFNGTGFKHGPYHGKRIWHLLKGDAEGHKYCGKKGCHNQSKCPNAKNNSPQSPRL